jgi:CheY-like chemotaxis protein
VFVHCDEDKKEIRNKDDATLRVLVVDPLDATRTVVETMLSRRGMQIATTARRDEGLRLAREFCPDVVVLDNELASIESSGEQSGEAARSFESASPENPPSLVILGNARRPASNDTARYLQKPYLYAALIHTIEELLAERRAA